MHTWLGLALGRPARDFMRAPSGLPPAFRACRGLGCRAMQTGARAAVRAAKTPPPPPPTLHRCRCFRRPGNHPGGHIDRSRRRTKPAHRAHGKGGNDARTAEGRVGTVELDAGGRPGLGWWWWLQQGPGLRRAGAQEQQQAAFEGAESRVRKSSIPEMRPRSPMKDKPTTRRPPAGLEMDDLDPLGSVAALASPEALAGPTYDLREAALEISIMRREKPLDGVPQLMHDELCAVDPRS